MIDANKRLFAHLDAYCMRRGQPLESAGKPRFVSSDRESKDYLQDLKVLSWLKFGNHRSLAFLSMERGELEEQFIALIGFDFEPDISAAGLSEANAGTVVCLLSEMLPTPLRGPVEVMNVLEIGHINDDEGYAGHEVDAIRRLFPNIQLLSCFDVIDPTSAWRLFLELCAQECSQSGSWIDSPLSEEIGTLTDLDIPSLPYNAVCTSMFDADPRSLFMALYRCIEATYAYESSRKIVDELSLDMPWQTLAAALEDVIGWHPKEASSLNAVLAYAVPDKLAKICECLGVEPGKQVTTSAGKAIYSLRNRIVHYRPGTEYVVMEEIDWNELCILLIGVVFDVFVPAYADTRNEGAGV